MELDRSTLADWVGHAAWHPPPLHVCLLCKLRQRSKLFADQPGCRCSIPAAAAPRPASSGPMLLMTGHEAAPIRPASPMSLPPTARPSGRFAGFKGILQVDGYAGYPKLAERGDVELAFWLGAYA